MAEITDNQAPQDASHLQKRFSKLTMVGMTFAILNTWIALAATLSVVLPSGGPVALVYGFIFTVCCNFCTSASLGELASVWPTAGAQYHWAYALCTERWRAGMSFLVGWVNIAGWLTLITTEAFFGSQLISAAIMIGSPGFEILPWQAYLIFVAISVYSILFNIFGYRVLGMWNDMALFWSIITCIVVSITILATSHKTTGTFVFTDFSNTTGWSDGVAWILGLLQSALSLVGYDAVTHMMEEMPRPRRDAPIAMMTAVGIGGITGFFFILVMLFCITNIDQVLNTSTGMPITELIFLSTGSRAAAVVLTCALAFCFVSGTIGGIASGSRLLWAMARDNGAPFSPYLSMVSKRLHVPVIAILVCGVFNLCFGLLFLASVAFNAYIASVTIFLNCSYAFPIVLSLIRGRKFLHSHSPQFRMGFKFGYAVNSLSVVFIITTSVFFCFPAVVPVGAGDMNYVSAVLGVFIIFVTVLWAFKRKSYSGPQLELITGDDPNVAANELDPSSSNEKPEVRNTP